MVVRGRRLIVLCIALVAITVVSVPVAGQSAPSAVPGTHLVVVPHSPEAAAALVGANARTVARYESFTLVEAVGADVASLVSVGGEVRDDMRQVRIGKRTVDPATDRISLLDKSGSAMRSAGAGDGGLAVVQYVGPLKDIWTDAVEKTGVTVVSYMAQNGQLVSGEDAALKALAALSTEQSFIRAVTPYTAEDKQLPGLARSGRTEIVVSTVAGQGGAAARTAVGAASVPTASNVAVAGIVQQRVAIEGADIAAIAALGGVVAIEPSDEPQLLDERAARIVDGQLNAGFQPTLGPGHRTFLLNNGFTSSSPVIIDITDEGVDKGVVPVPAGSHPDFFRAGSITKPSRLVYTQENTAADVDARDCGGHGTNVASIATGFNKQTGATVEDAQGFNYGVGIQPFGRLGATKIFNCAGTFDVQTSLTVLHANAYAQGARISNNSWGANVGGAYNARAQEFDALVRDAQPGVPGNQQFTEVVSAGNSGSGGNSIGSPGTAKNVITVGASESVRAIGATDGCGVTDAQADSARDVVSFSSRGPTDDGRTKPDVVAPGTHVTGAQPQTGAQYNGSGTCNPFFPAGSTLYSLVSGTSQAAPEVTGFASLLQTWFRNGLGGGRYPSPAMTKALMVNTATDLAGGANGAGASNTGVPTQVQGWGRINLGTVLDGTVRQVSDQQGVLGITGKAKTRYYPIDSGAKPLRVTLAWSDAPGPTIGNSYVNDLDLEVTAGGNVYKGNVLSGGQSVAGGSADPRNNLENVFLPAGATGTVQVRVIARNIAGDGVPGNADTTDQDYALVVSNAAAEIAAAPVLVNAGRAVTPGGDADGVLEPGEPFTIEQALQNVGKGLATTIAGTLSAAPTEATVTQPSATWPNIGAGNTAVNNPAFGATVDAGVVCGTTVDLSIAVTSSAGPLTLPVAVPTGAPGSTATSHASADVPKSIPDNNQAGVTSNLPIAASAIVSDVDVSIGGITHTFVGDLALDLMSPAGTTVRLFNHHGAGGDNFSGTMFDDQAATAITSGAAPYSGSFRPFEPLSAFNGQELQGTWKLVVRDEAARDVGTLNSWGIGRKIFTCS